MNFLAHAYLSPTDGQLVGNMIADFIRNRDRENYPSEIQQGIKLHRAIDSFTDAHESFREAKKVFSPFVRLYAGAFVDVAFDYFLANDSAIMNKDEWLSFSLATYRTLHNHDELLPDNFKRMLPYMEQDNWLFNYRHDWGIRHSMNNVLRKAKYLTLDTPVFDAFLTNKESLKAAYDSFFPELQSFAKSYY